MTGHIVSLSAEPGVQNHMLNSHISLPLAKWVIILIVYCSEDAIFSGVSQLVNLFNSKIPL